jgi:pyruvate dehydrogenase E1 component alpha subunit
MAEILGRATGLNGGRSGTLHMCDRSRGFLSTSAVVGGCIGLAGGAAYGIAANDGDRVCVAFFGDGALEEGLAFETFNIAALWKLPVIFVCENNSGGAIGQQGGGYPSSINAASRLSRIPECFGIATHVIDGNDIAGIHALVCAARAQCRSGRGPVFIEAMTERWPGSQPLWPEPATGTTDLAMAWAPDLITGAHRDWLLNYDPALRVARETVAAGLVGKEDLLAADADAKDKVQKACTFALASPFPAGETALQGVFAGAGEAR